MSDLVERLKAIAAAMGSFGSIEREAATRIEQLEAENARLQEALKPFARVAEHDIAGDAADEDRFDPYALRSPLHTKLLTVGHFRSARAALAGKAGE